MVGRVFLNGTNLEKTSINLLNMVKSATELLGKRIDFGMTRYDPNIRFLEYEAQSKDKVLRLRHGLTKDTIFGDSDELNARVKNFGEVSTVFEELRLFPVGNHLKHAAVNYSEGAGENEYIVASVLSNGRPFEWLKPMTGSVEDPYQHIERMVLLFTDPTLEL